jgi:hypothetical protein
MTEHDGSRPDDEPDRSGSPKDDGTQLLPAADPGKTDAEKYSTQEGRTEEDPEP